MPADVKSPVAHSIRNVPAVVASCVSDDRFGRCHGVAFGQPLDPSYQADISALHPAQEAQAWLPSETKERRRAKGFEEAIAKGSGSVGRLLNKKNIYCK